MSSSSSTENYGENLVINGEFDFSSSGWTLSGGASYDNGSILVQPEGSPFKTISQPVVINIGKSYLVEYTLSVISGSVTSSVLLGDTGKTHGASSGRLSAILSPTLDGYIRISIETTSGGSARIDNVSVKEIIENSSSSFSSSDSSFSSISSNSSISSMISSESTAVVNSSKSSSSSSSRSSYTSSLSSGSTNTNTTSSNSFSESTSFGFSSESSEHCGYLSFPFRISAIYENPIWCFERANGSIYAGTGPNGKILISTDATNWNHWKTVEDLHVKSMKFYANGLWIGTEPNGLVYVYNFTTDSFYPYIDTDDYCVSSMAVYEGKLYIGTSPGGIIYSFDGTKWIKHKEFYGGGITSMFSTAQFLYVSIKSAESIMIYNGTSWEIAKSAGKEASPGLPLNLAGKTDNVVAMPTIASSRNLSTEPVSRSNWSFIDRTKMSDIQKIVSSGIIPNSEADEVRPLLPECNIMSINEFSGKIIVGGKKGVIYQYDENGFTSIYDNKNSPVVSISKDGFFCTENSLYCLKDNTE